MTVGGVSGIRSGNQGQGGQGQQSADGTKEFSLEKQSTGNSKTTSIANEVAQRARAKTTQIVDKKKRNRRGAPRSIIVDGEIYEVFLLAIA